MAEKRKFDIAFVGLKQGVHKFTYELDKKFFVEKGSEDFSDLISTVQLSIEKVTGFMRLKFEVGGKAEVTCDRCGNPLKLDLWDEFNIIVKLVENPEEMNLNEEDPDIFYISRTESYLHVSDLLYEFVLLSLPMQKMCSVEEMGGPQCNLEVLNKLKDMERKEVENNANALWKGLEKFKGN